MFRHGFNVNTDGATTRRSQSHHDLRIQRPGETMGKPWENHGKTMGKPWVSWDFMGFYGILWDFMGFYVILWDFNVILWDFMGF